MSLASQKKRMWDGQERCSVGVVREREGKREFICFLTRACNFPESGRSSRCGLRRRAIPCVDGAAGKPVEHILLSIEVKFKATTALLASPSTTHPQPRSDYKGMEEVQRVCAVAAM